MPFLPNGNGKSKFINVYQTSKDSVERSSNTCNSRVLVRSPNCPAATHTHSCGCDLIPVISPHTAWLLQGIRMAFDFLDLLCVSACGSKLTCSQVQPKRHKYIIWVSLSSHHCSPLDLAVSYGVGCFEYGDCGQAYLRSVPLSVPRSRALSRSLDPRAFGLA